MITFSENVIISTRYLLRLLRLLRKRARLPLLAALAAAALAIWEICLTRVASLLFFHEMAYVVVSVGLLMMGAGALASARWLRPQGDPSRALRLLLTATPAAMAPCLVALLSSDLAWWAGLFGVPFALFGASLPLLYRMVGRAGRPRLYALELAGAALGRASVGPGLLARVGPAGAALVAAVVAAAAIPLLDAPVKQRLRALALGAALPIFGLLGQALTSAPWLQVPLLGDVGVRTHLRSLAESEGLRGLETRWSSYARTDLLTTDADDTTYLFTDGMFVARSVSWDGTSERFGSPRIEAMTTLKRLPAGLSAGNDTLVLGSGAGFDVAVALQQGARSVVAVEVNRDLVDFTRRLGDDNGQVYSRPEVTVQVEEARRFVHADPARYHRIQLTLMETSPAALRGRSHVHARLFTREAVGEYLSRLHPGGLIAVIQNSEPLAQKTAALLCSALGSEAASALGRLAVFHLPGARSEHNPFSQLVLASQAAWTGAQLDLLHEWARAEGVVVDWLPGREAAPPYSLLADGQLSLETWLSESPHLLRPPTDERPFFFALHRAPPLHVMVALCVIPVVLIAGARRHIRGRAAGQPRPVARLLALALVGAAAGFVQVAAVYRAQSALGLPSVAMGTALAGLLAGAGVGALLLQRLPALLKHPASLAVLAAVSCASLWLTSACWAGAVADLASPLGAQVAVLVLLGAHSLPMGLPFLTLMDAAVEEGPGGEAQAVGLDGIGMVVGSALATWAALLLGYDRVFLVAALCLLAAAALCLRGSRGALSPPGS